MNSLRSREGYLLIDHRFSPGIPENWLRERGIDAPAVPEGKMLETITLTCAHCRCAAVKNMDRTRERGYCSRCHHYICDACALVLKVNGECRPYLKRVEDAYAADRLIIKETRDG